jgi:tRNA-2-methylthio-N6-dimethylallyladenosine synthase
MIVGFPSETAEDFEDSRRFMEEMAFDQAFIFKYSPRPGTPAACRPDDVPDEEKLRRNHVLLADQNARGLSANRSLIGSVAEVLEEGVSRRNASRWTGRTRTNRIVVFAPRARNEPGRLVRVRIERAEPQTLYGTLKL